MGAYKFWNPTTQQYEIIKSKSIIKDDGSLEYTPDDIQAIDNKIGILNGVGETKEKANKVDLETHKADIVQQLGNKLNKSGDTATGIIKAYPNTSHTVAQMRNIILSPSNASVSSMKDGEIWIKYK